MRVSESKSQLIGWRDPFSRILVNDLGLAEELGSDRLLRYPDGRGRGQPSYYLGF